MIPWACPFAALPSFDFRSTRYGANAPGQTTSSMATSIEDDFEPNARASCEYDASEADGCGTRLTLMPVSFLKRATSLRSRLWLAPTAASPTKVIFWPWYFALSAARFGTLGGTIAADLAGEACVAGRDVPAAATLSDAINVTAPTNPATTSSARCFTFTHPFLRPNPDVEPFLHASEITPFRGSHSSKTGGRPLG